MREIRNVCEREKVSPLWLPSRQGIGIGDILEAVVQRVPAPADNRGKPLRALIFDSYYDSYKASCRASCLYDYSGLFRTGVLGQHILTFDS